jgi:hypothetical protein
MLRTASNTKRMRRSRPDFIDLSAILEPAETISFERERYRMTPRLGDKARADDATRFICVVDSRTNLERVSRQFLREGLTVAHRLDFINTLVLLGNPATVKACAERIGGIKALTMKRAGHSVPCRMYP